MYFGTFFWLYVCGFCKAHLIRFTILFISTSPFFLIKSPTVSLYQNRVKKGDVALFVNQSGQKLWINTGYFVDTVVCTS
jgi:hypothetical protein